MPRRRRRRPSATGSTRARVSSRTKIAATAAAPATASKAIVSVMDEPSANVTPSAAKISVSDQARVAAMLDTPRARASAHPGARTTAVAKRSRK